MEVGRCGLSAGSQETWVLPIPSPPSPQSPGQGCGNNVTRVQITSSLFVGSEGAPGSDSREGVTGLNDPVLCF